MQNNDSSRRNFIKKAAVLSSSVAASGLLQSAHASALIDPKVSDKELDLTKPEDNMHAIVKIQGDVSGEMVYAFGQGEIYGVLPDAVGDPMFKYQLARIGRYLKMPNGSYLYKYRGMIFYQDFETGEFIDEYTNPYTNKTVKVKHWHSSAGAYYYTTRGPRPIKELKGTFAGVKDESYILPWQRLGDRVWVSLDERVRYQRPSDGEWRVDNAILRYQSSWTDMNNPELTSARTTSSFQTSIDWFTWLDMKGTPGRHMQGGLGAKLNNIGEYPKAFYDYAEATYPGILSGPVSKELL